MSSYKTGNRAAIFDKIDTCIECQDQGRHRALLKDILYELGYSATLGEAAVNDAKEEWRFDSGVALAREARAAAPNAGKGPARGDSPPRGRRSAALEAIMRGTHPSLADD